MGRSGLTSLQCVGAWLVVGSSDKCSRLWQLSTAKAAAAKQLRSRQLKPSQADPQVSQTADKPLPPVGAYARLSMLAQADAHLHTPLSKHALSAANQPETQVNDHPFPLEDQAKPNSSGEGDEDQVEPNGLPHVQDIFRQHRDKVSVRVREWL